MEMADLLKSDVYDVEHDDINEELDDEELEILKKANILHKPSTHGIKRKHILFAESHAEGQLCADMTIRKLMLSYSIPPVQIKERQRQTGSRI